MQLVSIYKGQANPAQTYYRPLGLKQAEALRYPDSRHIKVEKFSALCIGRLYPQELFLVFSSLRA